MNSAGIIHRVVDLGRLARAARRAQRLTLETLSARAGVGMRFLSEFERGKETAEVGKVLAVLTSLGLQLTAEAIDAPATMERVRVSGHDAGPPPAREPRPPPASVPTFASPPQARPAGGGDSSRMWDMLAAATEIRAFLDNCNQEAFLRSVALMRAVERCFDVLGEAARRISPPTQARLPRIPWRSLVARRNGLVMGYENVDRGALFRAAHEELPGLIEELRQALPRGEDP